MSNLIKNVKEAFSVFNDYDKAEFEIKLTELNLKQSKVSAIAYLATLFVAYMIFFINPQIYNCTTLERKQEFLIVNFIPVIILSSILIFIKISAKYVLTRTKFINRGIVFGATLGLILIAYFCAFYGLKLAPLMYFLSLIYIIAISLYMNTIYKMLIYTASFVVYIVSCVKFNLPAYSIVSTSHIIVFAMCIATSISLVLYKTAEKEFRNRRKLTELNSKYQDANKQLLEISETDFLTGLPNRRKFDEYFNCEWNKAIRDKTQFSLCILDIDFFKQYNDLYGHLQGDECLRIFGDILRNSLNRNYDFISRYGGEEFAIIMPNSSVDVMVSICERINASLAKAKILHEKSSVSSYVTVSYGIVSIVPSINYSSKDFFVEADKALYKAKNNGRNSIAVIDIS